MRERHLLWKETHPDTPTVHGPAYTGIANARPETIEALKLRIDPKKVPFDPREAIKKVPEWDNLDAGWGIGE